MKIVGILYLAIIVSLSLPAQAQQSVRSDQATTTHSCQGENHGASGRKLAITANRDRLNRVHRVSRAPESTPAGVGEAISVNHPGRQPVKSALRRYRRLVRASNTVGYFPVAGK